MYNRDNLYSTPHYFNEMHKWIAKTWEGNITIGDGTSECRFWFAYFA